MARPDEIGTFSPEQCRMLWQDFQKRRQLQPAISQNLPQRRPVDEPSPHRVFVFNTTDETIPAYACMEAIGTRVVAGRTCIEVQKPTSADAECLFNSQFPIPSEGESQSGVGWAYRFGVVRMIGDAPSGPTEYQPIEDSWEVEEGGGPFFVFGEDNVGDGVLIGRFIGGRGSEYVIFEFPEDPYAELPDECDDREEHEEESFTVDVITPACGLTVGEQIEVFDDLNFTEGRDLRAFPGRRGKAMRFVNSEGGCKWVITYIDWWEDRIYVRDIVFEENKIVIKRDKVRVWDWCELPDEEIEGADCEPPDYEEEESEE